MNDNLVTIEVNGKVIFAGKADLQFSLNQKVREPLRITKGKGKLMEALTESFINGGINRSFLSELKKYARAFRKKRDESE